MGSRARRAADGRAPGAPRHSYPEVLSMLVSAGFKVVRRDKHDAALVWGERGRGGCRAVLVDYGHTGREEDRRRAWRLGLDNDDCWNKIQHCPSVFFAHEADGLSHKALRKRLMEIADWLVDPDNYDEALTTFGPHPDCALVLP